jgi:hypothetical protein
MDRKKLFLAALELAEINVKDWVAARRITKSHLYAVLAGKRESVRLDNEIDRFTAETLRKHRSALELALNDSAFLRSADDGAVAVLG